MDEYLYDLVHGSLDAGVLEAKTERPTPDDPLDGTFTINVRDDDGHPTPWRVGLYVTTHDESWVVYWLGEHDYDEPRKRMRLTSSRPGVHYHWLPDDDEQAAAHLVRVHGGRHAFRSDSTDPFDTQGVHEVVAHEGFTVHDHFGDAPKTGYMVSLAKDSEYSFPLDRISPEAIGYYRQTHAAALRRPDCYLGAWVYQGRVYLDVSQHVRSLDEAIRLGHERKQLGIYDLTNNTTIDTSVPEQRAASLYDVEVEWSTRTPEAEKPMALDTHRRYVRVEADSDHEAEMLAAQMVNGQGQNMIADLPDGMVTRTTIIRMEAAANGRGQRAWGKGDLDALFPDGASSTQVPWTDGRIRGRVDYDEDAVGAAMRSPGGHLAEVDPRQLSAIQGGLTRAGVAYYLTDEYARSGRTFADQDRVTNKHPIVYRRKNGSLVILTGHHRAAAALLQGKPLQCLLVEEPASVHAHRHAEPDGGRHAARAVPGDPGHLGAGGGESGGLRRGGGAAPGAVGPGEGDAGAPRSIRRSARGAAQPGPDGLAAVEALYFIHDVDEPLVDTKPMDGFEQLASFDWITNQIATGGAVRRASDLRILYRRGVRGVVSGRRDFDDSVLAQGQHLPGMDFLTLATPDDGSHKPVAWFKEAIDFCLPRLRRGEKVYVHCHAGMNRGPSLAYAVLRAYTGMSNEKALAVIRAARPAAKIAYADDADAALVALGYAKERAKVSTEDFHTLTGAAEPEVLPGLHQVPLQALVIGDWVLPGEGERRRPEGAGEAYFQQIKSEMQGKGRADNPIQVRWSEDDRHWYIYDGNHRAQAGKELGWKTLLAEVSWFRGAHPDFAALGLRAPKTATDDFLPSKGMFEPGRPTLDPRVFTADDAMKPEVRGTVLGLLDGYWRPLYGDWTAWARVYLAGSGASHWWDSDGDLDILVGIDMPALVAARPQNAGVSEADVCAHLNHGLKEDLDPSTAAFDFGPPKPMEVTFFCNPGSFDIRAIHPYAAYDLTANAWVVRPPVLPSDWSALAAPAWVVAHARQVAAMARHILSLPEPERTLQGTALFNRLHEWRQQAYVEGGGWLGFGNVVYQWLSQEGLLAPLYRLKHPEVVTATGILGSLDDVTASTAEKTVWMYGSDEPTSYHDTSCRCSRHCPNCFSDLDGHGVAVLGPKAKYCSEYCKGVAKRDRAFDRYMQSRTIASTDTYRYTVVEWRRNAAKPANADLYRYEDKPAGPWHALHTAGSQPQAWCGSKVKGFAQDRLKEGEPPEGEARCQGCVRAIAAGSPRPYRR